MSSMELRSSSGRTERCDQICLYVKLFLGMGIIWWAPAPALALAPQPLSSPPSPAPDPALVPAFPRYAEILAFTVGDAVPEEVFYFTDTINMLQVNPKYK